jgi:phospholipase/lecithinase/hemolysin
MPSPLFKRFFLAATVAAATVTSLPVHAAYGGLVIFGDSLSDSGNNFIAIGAAPPPGTPIPPITPNAAIANNSFIPALPFAGAPIPVYSNGPVWASLFAQQLGLGASALPSLAGGRNFAFGGAVTGGTTGFPFSLTDQVNQFLGATGGTAPSSFLYVVAGGGNDARAALASIAANPGNAAAITGAAAFNFANNVSNIVDELQAAGAKNIVVWNMPDLGKAPAVLATGAGALATSVSATMSGALSAALAGEVGVKTFDLSGTFSNVFANPGAYGLSNVTDACIMGACNASEYLFWDGIHPTARGHQILAQAMYAQVVPEPETYLLFAVGLAALAWRSRKRAS